ncbi:MAG TPA: SDR family oxidoreductase [Solirubrobacteraceae bacterium]|jgi:NAD(P)-dependent dehydrogenase (short-subunit alcohol dehydrogenase family)|nr:SDR family oxidoreductase [Solirubrobacteraceae bacterium]
MPIALITGASTGIGQATALRLARAGWSVLAGVRRREDGERLAGEDRSGRIEPLLLDVTDLEQIRLAAVRVSELGGGGDSSPGRLDALVNNAGIGFGGPLELISPEDLRTQFDVNVLGQVAVTQALLPALRAARGRLLFVSSVGGRVAMAFTAPYAASKYALEAIGDALRVELSTSNVQVALIEPGSVATPIWEKTREVEEKLTIPESMRAEYGHVPAAMKKTIESTASRGVPPEQVAETIEAALTAKRMKARYVIGRDARAMIAMRRLLSDHVFDRVAKRALGV